MHVEKSCRNFALAKRETPTRRAKVSHLQRTLKKLTIDITESSTRAKAQVNSTSRANLKSQGQAIVPKGAEELSYIRQRSAGSLPEKTIAADIRS